MWGDLKDGIRDRYLRVDSIGETHVECTGVQTRKKVSIRKDRLKLGSKRYYLAVDNAIIEEVRQLSNAAPEPEQKSETKQASAPTPETKPRKKKSNPVKAETPPTA